MQIRQLATLEFEWKSGRYDFHLMFEPELKTWLLEQFDSRVSSAEEAHLAEFECDSMGEAVQLSAELAQS